MFAKTRAFLRQPLPFRIPPAQIVIASFAVGLFVSAFLWIFKPFGSGKYVLEGRSWILWGYGFLTFLVLQVDLFIGPVVLPGFFNEKKWNLYRGIGFQLWHIVSIGTANLLFAAFIGGSELRLWAVPGYILQALAIGFFPLTFGMLSVQYFLLKKYAESTRLMNESIFASRNRTGEAEKGPTKLVLSPESGKDKVEIRIQDLLLIKSVDNYVEIYAADKGQVKKILLRSSLKRIERDVEGYLSLFKCHRAFLVNVNNISRVAGNSQGYKLVFEGLEFEVPVSRNISKDLFKLITRPRPGRISPQIG